MPRISRNTTWPGWDNSAALQAVAIALRNILVDCGLVQTSDTGQMDPATITKPGTNTDAGFMMFRFSDSLQSVAPVFLKVTIGVGTGATSPRFSFQIGSATDGAGGFVGLSSPQRVWSYAASTTTGANVPSFATHSSGMFALCFCAGAYSAASVACPTLVVQRTCDNTGAFTAEGVTMLVGGEQLSVAGTVHTLLFLPSPSLNTSAGNSMGFMPGNGNDATFVGLSPQAFNHFIRMPKVRPVVGSCGFKRGETSFGQTFPLQMVGTVPRNYISFGAYAGHVLATVTTAVYGDLAVLWED